MGNTTVAEMSGTSLAIPTLTSKTLESYVSSVFSIPNLEKEDEIKLSTRLIEEGCLESAKLLILPHLKYVVHVARGFKNYGLPQEDLIQEGNIGLMKAVKRFNPHKGVRLVTFAHHWIYAEIADYVVRNFRQVKIATTKAQRKLFFNLRKLKKSRSWMKEDEVKSIAQKLEVPESDVRQMEGRLTTKDTSFYRTYEDGDDYDMSLAPEDFLGTEEISGTSFFDSLDNQQIRENMYLAIESLDERSKDIIRSRWLDEDAKLTLHDLADKYGVSAERIRQVEVKALKKIKLSLTEQTE